MRGKTAEFLLHRQAGDPTDDLGRPTRTPDAGVPARGTAGPPSAVQLRGAPVTAADITVVAFVPSYTPVDWTVPGLWVEITGSRHPGVELGHYSIERRSGGRRVIRLELKRSQRQDGTYGGP